MLHSFGLTLVVPPYLGRSINFRTPSISLPHRPHSTPLRVLAFVALVLLTNVSFLEVSSRSVCEERQDSIIGSILQTALVNAVDITLTTFALVQLETVVLECSRSGDTKRTIRKTGRN